MENENKEPYNTKLIFKFVHFSDVYTYLSNKNFINFSGFLFDTKLLCVKVKLLCSHISKHL